MWRHRSRDHSIRHIPFPLKVLWNRASLPPKCERTNKHDWSQYLLQEVNKTTRNATHRCFSHIYHPQAGTSWHHIGLSSRKSNEFRRTGDIVTGGSSAAGGLQPLKRVAGHFDAFNCLRPSRQRQKLTLRSSSVTVPNSRPRFAHSRKRITRVSGKNLRKAAVASVRLCRRDLQIL